MDNQERLFSLNYDVVLPTHLLINQNIEPNAKLFYGIVRNLCRVEGYCWATNEYLSQLMQVSTREIPRWLNSLKEEGYIEVEYGKAFSKDQRRIYISDEFKKSLSMTKMSPPHDKNVTHKEDIRKNNLKLSVDEKISLKKNKKISFNLDTRKFENISDKDTLAWTNTFPKVSFTQVLGMAELWAVDNHRLNYRKSITSFLKNEYEKVKKVEEMNEKRKVTQEDVFKYCVLHKKNWSKEEIQEAYVALENYTGMINDVYHFIDGTIKNIRIKNSSNHFNKPKKGIICTTTLQQIKERKPLTSSNLTSLEEALKELDSQEPNFRMDIPKR